jgi:hypothetical protein
MKTNNILYAKMICPLCQQNVETEIKMDIGDTRQMCQYTIGDRIAWRRHALVQNGGRPGNGNIDVEGFSYSPVCGDRTSVKVIIRSDTIKDVVFNPDNDLNNNLPSSSYVHQPAQAMQVPQKPYLPNQGKVTFNFDPEWLTTRRQKIIAQLTEFGIDIYAPSPSAKYDEFRIMVPHELHPAKYIDIAYLMAQLVDESFREPLIEFVESYPHGVKYRVKKPDEE